MIVTPDIPERAAPGVDTGPVPGPPPQAARPPEAARRAALRLSGLASGVATLALGLFVVGTWHGRAADLVDAQTGLAPMPYNSALAFAFCGLALTGIWLARWRPALGCALAAGVLGAFGWIQDLAGREVPLVEGLLSSLLDGDPYAFRMAPITALGFLLSAVALGMLARPAPSARAVAACGLLANVLFALGAVPLLGFLAGLEAAFAWRDLTRISLLAAVGFTVLAPGLFVTAVARDPGRQNDGVRWLPAAAALGLSTLAGVLWLALQVEQREGLEEAVTVESEVAADDVEAALSERMEALHRMARRWEVRGGTPREEWQDDAQLFAAHLDGLDAVAYVGTDGRIRWLASERAAALPDFANPVWAGSVAPTGVWVTSEGNDGTGTFALHVPLVTAGEMVGAVTALHQATTFFDTVLGPRTRERLQIAVFDGSGARLYGPSRFAVADPRLTVAHGLSVADGQWRLVAAPTPAFVAQTYSWLPTLVLVTGLVLAGLVATCILLLQVADRRKVRLIEANSGLEGNIATRTAELERARQDLQRAYDNERVGRRRLRFLLDSLAEAIYAVDGDGNCTYCNAACLRMLGYERRDVIGRNMHQLIHHTRPDGTPYPMDECHVYRGLREGNGSHSDDELLWRADGTSFAAEYWSLPLLDQEGNLIAGVVTFFDISERKRATAELEQRHRQQAAVARLGMLALRGGDGTLMDEAARVAAETLNVEFAKVLELVPPGDRLRLVAGFGWKPGQVGVATVETGPNSQAGYTLLVNEPVVVTDLRTDRRFLGPRLLLDHHVVSGMSTIIHGRAGPWGVLGVHTARARHFDDSDLAFLQSVANLIGYALEGIQAAEEIRQLNDELELRVQRRTAELEAANRELESFSYSVSHDLRSPLRAIDGFADVLLEDHGEQLDVEGRRVLGVIQRNVARMGRLIDELLQFSRLSRRNLSLVCVDMTALAREVLEEILQHEGERRIDVVLESLPDAPGDPVLLHQVWLNLIGNAVKYTRGRDPAHIRIGGSVDDERWLSYTVRDDGVGFDMAYADKLFGVFQRLHRESEFEGTGVGLALVARIVARHGGDIRGEGNPGAGATFTFRLPREPER